MSDKKKLKPENLIVFDIDGTITDSVKLHQNAFSEMLTQIGIGKINSNFKSYKHHTDSFIVKEIYEANQNSPFTTIKMTEFESGLFQKVQLKKIDEIPGASQLINTLERNTNYGICYATGSLRRAAEHKLKSIGIEFNKKQLVASDNLLEREKIVCKAMKNAIEYYNVDKFDRIISIGDGLWDLLTAKNLNLEFIGIGLANKELLLKNGAKVVYENFLEFKL